MHIKSFILSISLFLFIGLSQMAGQVYIEGYTFESGNRGFLSQVTINAENAKTGEFLKQVVSDNDGKFVFDFAPGTSSVKLTANKTLFHEFELTIGPDDISGGKAFPKIQMTRKPGYIFEITLAEKADSIGVPTNHIRDALIEVYNNTTEKVVMVLEDHPQPDFKVNMVDGNHYTVMIRKEGYLTKRMEAFVNVEGCILCFEGVGEIRPGVTDNLSNENKTGTLLANVELEPVFEGKSIELQNIYYDYGKSNIREDAALELDKAAVFLKDNPQITVELGSHTDSRGKADKNAALSEKRAQSAVDYLVKNGDIERFRITARGYGESDLAVKCGSECTEEEHARNRRSEVKILGISKDIPYKSLEKIKYEENFDNIIAALQEEGQVKIPEDAELPEDFKKEGLDAVASDEMKAKAKMEAEAEMKAKEAMEEKAEMAAEAEMKAKEAIEEKAEMKAKEAMEAKAEMAAEAEMKAKEAMEEKAKMAAEAEMKAKEAMEEKAKIAAEAEMKAKEALEEKAKMAAEAEMKAKEAMEEKAKMAAEAEMKAKEAMETKSTEKAVMAKEAAEVMVKEEMVSAGKMSADGLAMSIDSYTGHKVVVAFRRAKIEKGDDLLRAFDDLSVYQANAGYYLYMAGDFETKVDAEAYLNTIKNVYPNAYVAEFDNGNRVN